MSFPAIIFGISLSIFFGAAFHLWRGGGLGRLLFYVSLSATGFWIGHFSAAYLQWTYDLYGDLHLFTSVVVCLLFLAVGYWLSPRQNNL